ncbi:MAG: integrase arm-type DNA-binding domain-containing protein [Steroidobacteraceae bacterium]
MALSVPAILAAKPREKAYKLFDERGLYLLVQPNGSRWWRLKYRLQGREKLLSLGVFPDVTLKRAREKRDDMRKQVADGVDPSVTRKVDKQAEADTFKSVALEWLAKEQPNWSADHYERTVRRFESNLYPWIGSRPVREISAAELLTCLRRIEKRGALDTAHRTLQQAGQVVRYAIVTHRAESDPTTALRDALPAVKVTHHASITDPAQVGALLRAMDSYRGTFPVCCALRLSPYVFTRPSELRLAVWSEFDLDGKEWRIPAARMKMAEQHIVPLSRQAVAILSELRALTGPDGYLFPGIRHAARPMSENTVNGALRALGYGHDDMTGHGFRSMASTLLNERGWNRDAIERQLAHGERNKVRAAYNYAEHLPERRKMMQAWADYLDGLKVGGKAGKAS